MNTHTQKPLKAYAVLEKGENTGGIVFARRDIEARKRGSCEYSDGDISSVSCRRAHWADAYASVGIVEAREAVKHGWRFECHGCGMNVEESCLEDDGKDVEGVIGTMDGFVFCCAECANAHDKLEAQRKVFRLDFIETMRGIVRKRFGDVHIIGEDDESFRPYAYVPDRDGIFVIQQAALHFHFPGQKIAPATLKYQIDDTHGRFITGPARPYFTCCNGDLEAFEAFAAATKKECQR